jgi:hypothetical protein
MAPRNGSTPRRRSSYPPRGTTGGRHSPQPNGEGPRRPIEGRQSRSRPTSRTVANGQGPGRPLWVFLVRGRFAAKTPFGGIGFPWISLDSLVLNETYQRVTRDFRSSFFRGAFSLTGLNAEARAPSLEAQKCRAVHEASLAQILILRNRLELIVQLLSVDWANDP